ncbi:unnamed protein product [Candidula unifasciata]|uniref:Glycoprotein hormone subunit beta domain-containing protein n=1 Tax=Candidula unifasciata TaxID=100452 RepID=A0A8S3ZT85_9EUPU|nr:unnamed protein product [Candidula unifasciata]
MPCSSTVILTSVILTTLVVSSLSVSGTRQRWEAPGCHLVGHTRTVTIADCVPFAVTTNACRGFCVSYAVPSSSQTMIPNQVITSKAQCCGIVETHEVNVWVACRNGFQQKTFKSALSCACSICRRNHLKKLDYLCTICTE